MARAPLTDALGVPHEREWFLAVGSSKAGCSDAARDSNRSSIGSWHRTASGLRVQVPHLPPGGACLDNLVISPVVIAINPKQIDVHHRLRVSLYYRKGVIRGHKPVAFTAPPL